MIRLTINATTRHGSASVYYPDDLPDGTRREFVTAIAKLTLSVECPTWQHALLTLHYYDNDKKVFLTDTKQYTIHR